MFTLTKFKLPSHLPDLPQETNIQLPTILIRYVCACVQLLYIYILNYGTKESFFFFFVLNKFVKNPSKMTLISDSLTKYSISAAS